MEYLQVTQFITWLLVIGGWFVVNQQNNTREARKELRALLDKIHSDITEIESKSIKFHISPYDESLANDITRRLNRLASKITTSRLLAGEKMKALSEYRKSITLMNFDKSDHKELSENCGVISNLLDSQQELVDTMESAFYQKYQTQPWLIF